MNAEEAANKERERPVPLRVKPVVTQEEHNAFAEAVANALSDFDIRLSELESRQVITERALAGVINDVYTEEEGEPDHSPDVRVDPDNPAHEVDINEADELDELDRWVAEHPGQPIPEHLQDQRAAEARSEAIARFESDFDPLGTGGEPLSAAERANAE